jgi:hypothetical protein
MKDFLKGVYEEDLYKYLVRYFKSQDYSIEVEVPIYRNRIDMIAFNNEQLIAVELKLKDWKCALRQATYYQLGADLSYIAMPFYQALKVYRRTGQLESHGVGLLAVMLDRWEVRELIKPKPSARKVDYIERGIYQTIRHRH